MYTFSEEGFFLPYVFVPSKHSVQKGEAYTNYE